MGFGGGNSQRYAVHLLHLGFIQEAKYLEPSPPGEPGGAQSWQPRFPGLMCVEAISGRRLKI